jgi:hypothetical protein
MAYSKPFECNSNKTLIATRVLYLKKIEKKVLLVYEFLDLQSDGTMFSSCEKNAIRIDLRRFVFGCRPANGHSKCTFKLEIKSHQKKVFVSKIFLQPTVLNHSTLQICRSSSVANPPDLLVLSFYH